VDYAAFLSPVGAESGWAWVTNLPLVRVWLPIDPRNVGKQRERFVFSADASGRALTLARFRLPTRCEPSRAAEFFRSKRRTMVMRKTPSPEAKKVIVKHMVKNAKKLRAAYAKGKKKKFQAAFGRLSAAMIDVGPKGREMTPWVFAREPPHHHR
jgi:hypothetical protein